MIIKLSRHKWLLNKGVILVINKVLVIKYSGHKWSFNKRITFVTKQSGHKMVCEVSIIAV